MIRSQEKYIKNNNIKLELIKKSSIEMKMSIFKKIMNAKFRSLMLLMVMLLSILTGGCGTAGTNSTFPTNDSTTIAQQSTTAALNTTIAANSTVSLDNLPAYSDKAYIAVGNNKPFFTDADYTTESFEKYSDLDSLGRCSVAYANVGKDIMPTEARGSIGSVKPTGWQTIKYDIVDGKYLYNRCHLIGFQLTGENANKKNLITGTRYLNIEGMLPFENMVADYVKETGNHVLYRVTPIFKDNNLVAEGVLMEGYSVEDQGEGICFNVFAYNVQPGIIINYETGESQLKE